VSKKGMTRDRQTEVCMRNLPQKAERGKKTGGVCYQFPASVLLQEIHVFCARNMWAHLQRTTSECQRYEKRDEKLDSCAAKKGIKKLVSSNFTRILE
jgi:hypothetical protein